MMRLEGHSDDGQNNSFEDEVQKESRDENEDENIRGQAAKVVFFGKKQQVQVVRDFRAEEREDAHDPQNEPPSPLTQNDSQIEEVPEQIPVMTRKPTDDENEEQSAPALLDQNQKSKKAQEEVKSEPAPPQEAKEDPVEEEDEEEIADMDDFIDEVEREESELEIQKAKEQALLYLSQNLDDPEQND